VTSYNQMDFIFINSVTRLDYYAVLNIVSMYQKIKGTLILKTSQLFYKQSMELMVALNSMYAQVVVVQPSVSDPLSGDMFIVCKGRHKKELTNFQASSCPCPTLFSNKIEELNIYFGKKQLECLQKYMENVCTATTSSQLVKANVVKCIHWCKTFHVPHYSPTDMNIQ